MFIQYGLKTCSTGDDYNIMSVLNIDLLQYFLPIQMKQNEVSNLNDS